MAFNFDATPGGASANSLCTVEFADDHLGGELYADEWTEAEEPTKQKALAKATRRLERFEYLGDPTTTTQSLKHPRYGLGRDGGSYYDGAEVAEPFKAACAELALYYLRQNPAEVVDPALKAFEYLRIAGAVELKMRDRLPDEDEVPANVLNLIRPWLSVQPGGVRLLRA